MGAWTELNDENDCLRNRNLRRRNMTKTTTSSAGLSLWAGVICGREILEHQPQNIFRPQLRLPLNFPKTPAEEVAKIALPQEFSLGIPSPISFSHDDEYATIFGVLFSKLSLKTLLSLIFG